MCSRCPRTPRCRGYSFCIGDRRIEGEIDRRKAARERYEDAIVQGHTAALLEQERSSLFTQQIGNVPPGARVVCEVAIDQRLRWIEEGSWEWRFPLAAAPRYLGGEGRVADAGAPALEVATRCRRAHRRPWRSETRSRRDVRRSRRRTASTVSRTGRAIAWHSRTATRRSSIATSPCSGSARAPRRRWWSTSAWRATR
jgi:hypothetical protein